MMIPIARVTTMMVLAAASSVGARDEEPQLFDVVVAEREVFALVEPDDDSFMDDPPVETEVGPLEPPLAANVEGGGKHGSSGSAEGEQTTDINVAKGRISGTGKVTGEVTLGGGEEAQVHAAADSRLFVNLQIPIGTPYVLAGRLIASTTGAPTCFAGVTVSFSLSDNHFVDCSTPPEQECFCFRGTTLNTSDAFAIEANAFPEGGGDSGQVRRATADFVFSFVFGDLVFADDFELGSTATWDLLGCPATC